MAKYKGWTKLIGLFALGSLIGTIITLLLAPKSGRETRSQLKEHSLKFVEKAKSSRTKKEYDPRQKQISNWGNYPQRMVEFYEFEDIDTLRDILKQTSNVIPRGNGRCYGDSALAPQIISSLRYNKFLDFDPQQGTIRCQAGVILADILDVIVPHGWYLPVTPGTKLISVGGAIASNVHGKSQHKAGNFSDHLVDMELMLADGTISSCSSEENSEQFWTTCGGMGLTGVILSATMRLIPVETAYVRQEALKAKNLDHLMDLFEQSEGTTYSLAWIDCLVKGKQLGRGILMRGEHATLADLEKPQHLENPLQLKPKPHLNIPFTMPSFLLNPLTARIFNMLVYYGKQPRDFIASIIDYNDFFYPLDMMNNWNRLYGKRGFTQYQFVLPKANSREGLTKILQKIGDSNMPSFLAVLKLYGEQNGSLPFSMAGYSLALDFPIRAGLFEFLDELDQIVLACGGRVYLTKDVRMGKSMFMRSYPQAEDFIEQIQALNHGSKFRSLQSDRIGLTS